MSAYDAAMRGGHAAAAPDRDDLARLHPRLRAAGDRQRRVGGQPPASLGTGVIGGMLGATVIAMFFIPMFYWALESLSDKFGGGKAEAAKTPPLPPQPRPEGAP